MNPYGYQLYQVQRTKTRAEILADDARRGRQAAAVFRGSRTLAGEASTVRILDACPASPVLSRLAGSPDPSGHLELDPGDLLGQSDHGPRFAQSESR